MAGMGMNQGRPFLFILIDDTVCIYEMFEYDNGVLEHLAIRSVPKFFYWFRLCLLEALLERYFEFGFFRFKRVPYSCITRHLRFQGTDGRAEVEMARDTVRLRTVFHPFERVGNIVSFLFISSVLSFFK